MGDHNDWAHTLRLILAVFWGRDMKKWPHYADELIYFAAKYLVQFYAEGPYPR
jgi:hypothetical protein